MRRNDMGRKRATGEKEKKRKKVTVKLLERKHAGKITEAYRIMDDLIDKHHNHLADAKIAIAWRFGWNQDADGRLRLGQAKKGSDLDRELHHFDFVILLNHEAWNKGGLKQEQKLALVDHELCHCEVSMDVDGEPKVDEEGRTVYRVRKHDIEEFLDVVNRHGCYTNELAKLAQSGINDSDRPLLPKDDGDDPEEGAEAAADTLETDILRLSNEGKSRRAIAEEMGVTQHQVRKVLADA